MKPRATILLLSHSGEPYCTQLVAGAIEAQGGRAIRLDTDDFPSHLSLSASLEGEGGALLLEGQPFRIDAVWCWRLWPARLDERLSAPHREAALRESAVTLRGFLEFFSEVPWIDAPDVSRAADNKIRQLRVAQRCGLPIPPTLITSSPEAARRFYEEQGGQVICKLQTSLTYGMSGGGGLPTRLLRREDLEALGGLRHCPMVFQRYIPKARELRVVWVDGDVFVGALDGARCGVDWRYEATAAWEHGGLPPDVREKIDRLMKALDLRQGALDLIQTPQGEHVFLEVNPLGEWGMLERDLGLPIGEALARALLRSVPSG